MLPLNEILIKEARKLSLTDSYGAEYGIPQDTYVASLKKANHLLQTYLALSLREPFVAMVEEDATTSAERVTPTDAISNNFIYSIQYSADGSAANYEPLRRVFDREAELIGEPETYYLQGDKYYVNPVPSSTGGKFRIRYEKALEDLDIRRGTVSSVAEGTTYWELTLADTTSGLTIAADDEALSDVQGDYVSIVTDVDGDGFVREAAVRVAAYDSTTHILTTSFLIGGDAPSVAGDYICIGRNATVRSKLPPVARSFFVEFMKNDVYEPISSTDAMESNPKLSAVLSQLIELYSITATHKIYVPENRGDC